MHQLCKAVRNFMKEEEGATAVEYGVLVALIIAAVVAVIAVLGERIENAFEQVNSELSDYD
ncbi:MAG: Flp family type IVb pilin [Desulfurivibrionaceae bacterium]|nr:Flp family type IVb pilin [Desulfurivibrionaceae bacterium]